jgi:hypothetical protein
MRDYKFRGMTKEGKLVYGGLIFDPQNAFAHIVDYSHIVVEAKDGFPPVYDCIEVIPESVDQLTGLPDKNGKEIYHKDILDWDGNRFVIEWDNDSGMYYGKPFDSNKERGILSGCAFNKCIKIGNIYENPELIVE